MKEGVTVGAFAIGRSVIGTFSDKQIALLQNFAAQAVIAMENARLIIATRETLEQQTATAEVLAVINSSPGDLAPVFDTMLEKAMHLCGGTIGGIFTFDGDHSMTSAVRGVTAAFQEYNDKYPMDEIQPGTVPARIIETKGPVQNADVTAGEAYRAGFPYARALVDLGGIRAVLAVPLLKDGVAVGMVTIYRQEAGAFSDKQIALLQNFAAQAVIAMENARLLTEQREALEQQTATAEVLQVINASPGELGPVFDAMLERTMRLCSAVFGALTAWDGKYANVVATRGFPPALAEYMASRDPRLAASPVIARLAETKRPQQLLDVMAGEGYRNGHPDSRAVADLGGARTILHVPLRKDEAMLGYVSVYRNEVCAFSDKEIALLENFAAQAVIAMENARLINEQREALEQQTATAEVLQVINSSLGDLKPVFDAMLEKAIRLCESAFGILSTYDGASIHTAASRGATPALADFLREPIRPGPGMGLYRLVNGEDTVHVADITDDKTYRLGAPGPKALADLGGARAVLLVALRKDGALLGAINIFRQEVRPFSDKQIALLQNFAAQAVIAMENARLIAEQREALEQQTATAEVLQVINSSPGDLAPVFDAILDKAHSLCGATVGNLMLYKDGHFHTVATHGFPEQLASLMRRPLPLNSFTQRLIDGERFRQIEDIRAIHIGPDRAILHALARYTEVRTHLLVPLRKDGGLIGSISANRPEVRPFNDKEIALLENFAAQAVIAIENARLLDVLRQRTEQVAELNRGLETRVAEQVEELGRVGRLKRFLAPQLAELIVSQGNEKILESHRREIVVVFCDLRGYTAFTETAEPEEVLDFLRDYHGTLGPLVAQFEGTLDQFSGDGIMVFFNDPVPVPDPAARAVNMAMAMRGAAATLIADWRERGRDLGFGVGIAQGYATLGQIGFSERSGYTAIGTVCNVAARLCAEARDGQILLSQRINAALRGSVVTEQVGALALKGLTQPVVAYNVPVAGSQAAFRVIEGGPTSA
ncbi:MAG TPA: GAF domain-containing protein [Acetobacteraceae bacterium]|nr:GAF domain-containing protein [Acetobacteraceae bacterium]